MGGDTAGLADPNWPNKTGYLIPCAIMLGDEWGSWPGEGNHCSGARWALGSERVALCIPLFLSVLLFLLFTSFAVMLNCPYPSPRVSPFSFHSSPHPTRGRGADRPRGPLLLVGAKPR